MDVKLINQAFLNGLTVEILEDGEIIGAGKIVQHAKDTIRLDDGMYYYKSMFELRLK